MRLSLPLLHDAHSHGSLYAALAGAPDISALGTEDAVTALRALPDDGLTLVTGYRNAEHRIGPGELAALPPALIVNSSLHGYLATDSALPFLREICPEIGEHRGDTAWKEAHIPFLFARYTAVAGLDDAKIGSFLSGLEKLGVGSTEDMSVSAEAYRVIRRSPFRERFVFWMSPEEYESLKIDERPGVRGIKLYLDGSFGARTAAARKGYRDGGRGLLTWRFDALVRTACEILERDGGEEKAAADFGLALHAIGEDAIDQALDAAQELHRIGTPPPGGIRIEHAQLITHEQACRARDLGIVLSMQPNFTSDSVMYADRLDASQLAANNPFRMLMDRAGFVPGKDLVFGSDGMPHGAAYSFQWSLFPPYPGQRLTVDELVAGYGGARGVRNGGFEIDVTEPGASGFRDASFPVRS